MPLETLISLGEFDRAEGDRKGITGKMKHGVKLGMVVRCHIDVKVKDRKEIR